ncbi:hypothetical protein EW026_g3209 [Hermanssonia centrifuga]|uniref:Uncharacterized protein n=1 Tax=Hermanssonia centrifuga TaxID=98765 RepID=A0A4S4KQH2_9APHY|nr:hypothetical protein EW026_g3209 [Hermanssonia centrifuga]
MTSAQLAQVADVAGKEFDNFVVIGGGVISRSSLRYYRQIGPRVII